MSHPRSLDELFVKIQGRQQNRWRVVDEDGDVVDRLRSLLIGLPCRRAVDPATRLTPLPPRR